MIDLPSAFTARMRASLGGGFDAFMQAYAKPAEKAVRVNTLKISVDEFRKISPFALEPVLWEPNGFYVDDGKPGKTPLHAAGLYYVQEPSAMSAAPELDVRGGERVLDLCSAPGGKGTQLAQNMCGEGIIFLNEIIFRRAKILSSNVERLGIKNAAVTCASPEELARTFANYFDKILVDAPCSGEGMFKKEPAAITEWSPADVNACADRQKSILECADTMLAGGGRIVYSTCTFSEEEDERVTESFLSKHKDYTLLKQRKLYPHEIRGEGHYFAVLQKGDGTRADLPRLTPSAARQSAALYKEWERENLGVEFGNIRAVDKTLYSMPPHMPATPLQTLRAGVRLGDVISGRFEPSHSLAMCLDKNTVKCIDVDEKTALNYLKGLTFGCAESIKGWRCVTYLGYPLGWCKAGGGVAKNHLPKGLRI